MADTPAQPPGWPYNQDPETNPAAPGAPAFEPQMPPVPAAPVNQPAPPVAPPPVPPAAVPAAKYPPPATPYEPPYPAAPPSNQYAPPQPGYAQPPPPAPGWGPPAAPPNKSNVKKILITLGVIVGVLALAVGACTVWFVGAVKAPVDESNRFLAAIDSGDYQAAAAMSDSGCNAGMTAGDLDDLFAGRDITYDLKSSSVVNSSATVSGSFSADGLPFSQIELSLRNNGGWSVCGFSVD